MSDEPFGMDDASETDPLAPIAFESPGRFAIHNPEPSHPERAALEQAPFRLGESASAHPPASAAELRPHALALVRQARRSICISSADMEPWLYDEAAMQQACTAFLLQHGDCRLRLLVRDPALAIRRGHRLLSLARRLTSRMEIRRAHPDHPGGKDAFLLADRSGLLWRPDPREFQGRACYHEPGRVRQFQARFDEAWNLAIHDPDLRSLLL